MHALGRTDAHFGLMGSGDCLAYELPVVSFDLVESARAAGGVDAFRSRIAAGADG